MSHHVGMGGTWNQFKQPEHLESISAVKMDLNKSFAFFDIEIPPFSVTHVKLIETEAPDGPEGQEQPVQAVGGQGELRGVTQLPSKLNTGFFLKPRFLGMGNHLGPFSEAPDGPQGQEQPVQAVGGQGELTHTLTHSLD